MAGFEVGMVYAVKVSVSNFPDESLAEHLPILLSLQLGKATQHPSGFSVSRVP